MVQSTLTVLDKSLCTGRILQNLVSLGATKITPNDNIRPSPPEKRRCYFNDHHEREHELEAHETYSQVYRMTP